MNYINNITTYLNKYLIYYLTGCLIIITIISGLNLYYHLEPITKTIIKTKNIYHKAKVSLLYVDIKGAVNKPGVYQVSEDMLVNDVITLAGGLTKNADTSLINLSKKLQNNMVIIIYTKSEIKAIPPLACPDQINNACIEDGEVIPSTANQIESKLININTATKANLMTLSGIGETKANAIINYRNIKPFTKIEDIMNVSGIGTSTYDQIKESITI